ncbi:MAG: site-specific DNA-methyltransferase [Anaerolineales bacterium]|jgi:DNA modification methylase
MKPRRRNKPFARLQWLGRTEAEPSPVSLSLNCEVHPSSAVPSQFDRLILGESGGVMATLLPEYEGMIDLIYADPPFLSGKAYAARVGRKEDSRRPSEWNTIEGYRDTWPGGAAYLDMLYPRLKLMHRLLASTGTLYLHLDWHASAYARVMLDEIFGPKRLLNEIIWTYHGPSPIRSAFKRKHDTILVYTKTTRYTFNADAVRVAYAPQTMKTFASSEKAGFGKVPDLKRGKVPEDWWYFPVIARLHKERTGYPTQKPEALVERILAASSDKGDLVFDPFCGSGTTAVVASRMNRGWIACDINPLAVQTSYRRLLLAKPISPFTLWRADGASERIHLKPQISIQTSGRRATVKLNGVDGAVETPGKYPANIVLWEIDWDSTRPVFQSRSQKVRIWRGENIDLEMSHEYAVPGKKHAAVRVVDAVGNTGVAHFPIPLKD